MTPAPTLARVRGVIFDKDGTLFDFATTWEAWADAFLRRLAADPAHLLNLSAAVGFDSQTGHFAPDSIVIAGTPEEVARALMPHLTDMSLGDVLDLLNSEAISAPQVEAVPLRPFLTGLRGADLRLGVVTNDAEAPARAHLEKARITELFDFIAGFDSGYGAKPAPGQLLAFAQALSLHPAQIVMVGDSLHDLMAARAAGMRAIGVLTGLARTEELAPFAEVVLPDIGHIPDWLRTQNTTGA